MPWYDLPLEQLREYRTSTPEPDNLDGWWAGRLQDARDQAKPVTLTRHEPHLYGPTEVYDAEFSGADGDRIKAWYIRPQGTSAEQIVVKYIGYGGGRGAPAEHMLLPSLGYPVLVMDTRGQGGRWTYGATGDGPQGGPENSQVMTRGVLSPETYYFTRLITDAALAVDAAAEIAGADSNGGTVRIGVTGSSQGGALALASAALHGDRIAVCQPDVPFLCDIQRAITLAPSTPYAEVPEFLAHNGHLADRVLDTLRYVDCALLARRVTAPTLMSVGLMDPIVPPSTVFAAYNEITAPKEIAVHPYSTHDVPGTHAETRIRHLREHLPA